MPRSPKQAICFRVRDRKFLHLYFVELSGSRKPAICIKNMLGWEERELCVFMVDLIIGRVGGVFLKTIPVLTDGYIHFRGQVGSDHQDILKKAR